MILGMLRNCFLPCNVFPLEWCIVCVFLRIMYRSLSWFLKCGFFFFKSKVRRCDQKFSFLCSSTIRDKIIPHAVSWFTGEAAPSDDFEDNEDSEDEEEAED